MWNFNTLTDYLLACAMILFLIYIENNRRKYDFFSKRNIPFKKPLFYGLAAVITRSMSLADITIEKYNEFKGSSIAGVFVYTYPLFMVRDPELLKLVMVKDFDHFTDRINKVLPAVEDPIFNSTLAILRGEKWKRMRNILSPAFTPSKVKGMFTSVLECGEQMLDHIKTCCNNCDNAKLEFDMKDIFNRFSNNVIARAAFGIECNSFKNPHDKFYESGKNISETRDARTIKTFFYTFMKRLTKYLEVRILDETSCNFLLETVLENFNVREKNGITRADIIDTLMKARKEVNNARQNGTLDHDFSNHRNVKTEITEMDITIQSLIFFLGAFDTVATTLSFTSVLLATNMEVQKHLQDQIDQTLDEYGGKITYEAVQSMKYLDMVISESMRLYPPLPTVDRICVKPYKLPATESTPAVNLNIDDLILIPVAAIHRDPLYFPDPEKFDPERFSNENKHKIKQFTYMPFGVGPRNCIGSTFGLMECKVALVCLLSQFCLVIIDKSPVPIRLQANNLQLEPDKGFWLGIKSRKC